MQIPIIQAKLSENLTFPLGQGWEVGWGRGWRRLDYLDYYFTLYFPPR